MTDRDDQWTEAIAAAHPTQTRSFKQWETALEMVGNRHSKGALVELVNWLLVRADTAEQERDTATARVEHVASLARTFLKEEENYELRGGSHNFSAMNQARFELKVALAVLEDIATTEPESTNGKADDGREGT